MPRARNKDGAQAPGRTPAGSRRRPALRTVILGDEDAQWLAEEGQVISARPEALTIRAQAPFLPGDRVFIEFPVDVPGEPHRTAIIRGQVTGVEDAEGAFLLDVRLNLMPDLRTAHVGGLPRNRDEAATLMREARGGLESAGRAGTLPVADIQRFLDPPRAGRASESRHRWRRYALAGAALAAILIALLLTLFPAFRPRMGAWQVTGLPGREPLTSPKAPAGDHPGASLGSGGLTDGAAPESGGFPETEPYAWQPGDWIRLDGGVAPGDGLPGAALQETAPVFSPTGWILATLQPALEGPSAGAARLPGLAFVVSDLFPAGSAAPSATSGFPGSEVSATPENSGERPVAVAQATEDSPPSPYGSSANAGGAGPAHRAPGPSPGAAETRNRGPAPTGSSAPVLQPAPPVEPAPGSVAVRVDKSGHTLSIRHDGEEVARFPVGLGRSNATPEGEFVIANKVTDPDWSDRGRIVKAGDPENPLGRRWMGLGKSGRATPYGIHPTNEPRSIGADMSRGCIRMRPEDAETVFHWCPVGTRVTIAP